MLTVPTPFVRFGFGAVQFAHRLQGKEGGLDLPLFTAVQTAQAHIDPARSRQALGYALDEWRIEQLCALHAQGIEYVGESQNWSEWWTLWRRTAGGLPAALQEKLLAELAPSQQSAAKTRSRLATAIAGSHDDMLRLVASLERLPIEQKVEVGERLLERLRKGSEKALGWWALGRIGARQSLYGSAHQVVLPEVAGRWLEAVLAVDWKKVEPAAFAATQLARLTGDRSRDLPGRPIHTNRRLALRSCRIR